jgi:hypothetical protein
MSDYFLLEVFSHGLALPGGPDGTPSSGTDSVIHAVQASPGAGHALSPLGLAFQFLDYPLLLTYGPPGGGHPSDWAATTQSDGSPGVAIAFGTGKSCIFQEELDELRFVLEKVRQGTRHNVRVCAWRTHAMRHAPCSSSTPCIPALAHVHTPPCAPGTRTRACRHQHPCRFQRAHTCAHARARAI